MTRKLKLMLLCLPMVAFLVSCSQEKPLGTHAGEEGVSEVTFSMQIPANHSVTRALIDSDEYAVETLDVLLFDTSNGTLLSRSTHSGLPVVNGYKLTFMVKLEKADDVDYYDFILLANSSSAIDTRLYSGGNLRTGMTKDEVQEELKETLAAGTGWITNTSASSYKPMPMWGEITNQTLANGKTYPETTMLRMVSRIDLEVALKNADGTDNTTDDFQVSEVWLYNYRTEGHVIPEAGNITSGKATAPTLNDIAAINKTDPINYSNEISGNKLIRSIYTFEASEGSTSDFANNVCLVIKGSMNNGTESWYRLDMANVDASTLTPTYMALLRNHHYKVYITMINGPGFPGKEEAYKAKPGNVGVEIVQWDDSKYVNGIWNGNYEIRFSAMGASFTQFGEPSPQEVSILTNVPELTFDGFVNVTKGAGDSDWSESPAGTWTNGHFDMVVTKGATVGEYTEYTLTFNSAATISGDLARETRFRVKGQNLEATLKIVQDAHVEYRLITVPDALHAIMIDGARQRIRVEVTSTHDYDIELNTSSTAMFSSVWDSPSGGNQITTLTGIDKSVTVVYVEADVYSAVDPRIGNFIISHTDTNSDAAPQIFNVLQVSPAITATLEGGGYTTEVQKPGGSVTINVLSNMSGWEPVLFIDGSEVSGDLSGYFDITAGSGNGNVVFTAPALADNATVDRVFSITFSDMNSSTESTPAIVITQKAKLLGGGGGGIPPTGGVRAEPGILSVNSKGQLNLDGEGWIVYFKWGSSIAISGGANGEGFNKFKVAWTPEDYSYDDLMADIAETTGITAWDKVPYQSQAATPIVEDPSGGKGDPCKLAVKDGAVGDYKMPAGKPYNGYSSMGPWTQINGRYGRNNTVGTQFYPAAGYRVGYQLNYPSPTTTQLNRVGEYGYYWSSTPFGKQAYTLNISINNSNNYSTIEWSNAALPIRCITAN